LKKTLSLAGLTKTITCSLWDIVEDALSPKTFSGKTVQQFSLRPNAVNYIAKIQKYKPSHPPSARAASIPELFRDHQEPFPNSRQRLTGSENP
jgi:hypothetical protein